MKEHKDFYSPEEVAELLGLHVRTVRRFIREGKLTAVRIGKQYRVATAELEAFVGSHLPRERPAPVHRHRRALVSATVDIDAISREESDRVTNLILGAFNSRRGAGGDKRLECIYYEEQGRLRLVMNAELSLANAVLGTVASLVAAEPDERRDAEGSRISPA